MHGWYRNLETQINRVIDLSNTHHTVTKYGGVFI
jgi:hypothetical protein